MAPWHPDHHASATSPSLLRDDQISAQQSRGSIVAARRAQSVTVVPSSWVTRKCRSPRLRSPPGRKCPIKGCLARGPPQFLKKRSENAGSNENLHVGSGNGSGSCSENCSFRIAQVVRSHSENGILHSESQFLNSESCSENTPELFQSSENALFAPRAFFLKLGWSPGFWKEAKCTPKLGSGSQKSWAKASLKTHPLLSA